MPETKVDAVPNTATAFNPADYAVQFIPIEKIQPSRHQARQDFDQDALRSLAESIRDESLLEPIVVRIISPPPSVGEDQGGGKITEPPSSSPPSTAIPLGEHKSAPPYPMEVGRDQSQREVSYEVVAGERRLRACKLLCWTTIPARVIATVSEGEAAAKGLVENLQREDLNPIEEAQGFTELNHLDLVYWTKERIAQVTGKSRSYVSLSISLLDLSPGVKESVRRRTLTRSHGLEIVRLNDPLAQEHMAKSVLDNDLTARQTRKLVDEALGKADKKSLPPSVGEGEDGGKTDEVKKQADPLASVWESPSCQPSVQESLIWSLRYHGDLKWTFEANLSKLPIDKESPTPETLRQALGTYLVKVSKALGVDPNQQTPQATNLEVPPKPEDLGQAKASQAKVEETMKVDPIKAWGMAADIMKDMLGGGGTGE